MKLLICSFSSMVVVACAAAPSDDGEASERREDPSGPTYWECSNNTNGDCISVQNVGSTARQMCLDFCRAAGAANPSCHLTPFMGCGS